MPNKAFAADFGKAGEKRGCSFLKVCCARLPEAAETRAFSANANSRVAENDAVAPDSAKGRSQVNRVVSKRKR